MGIARKSLVELLGHAQKLLEQSARILSLEGVARTSVRAARTSSQETIAQTPNNQLGNDPGQRAALRDLQ